MIKQHLNVLSNFHKWILRKRNFFPNIWKYGNKRLLLNLYSLKLFYLALIQPPKRNNKNIESANILSSRFYNGVLTSTEFTRRLSLPVDEADAGISIIPPLTWCGANVNCSTTPQSASIIDVSLQLRYKISTGWHSELQ